jgi:L-fuconolactonase
VRPVRDDNRSISWMLDRRLERGWRALATNGLTLDILVQDWREIPMATALAQGNPELTIILDHCGKPDIAGELFDPWARYIEEMAGVPNVNCKLSGLMNCAKPGATLADVGPYAAHVLSAFGPSRVMWASDWPPLDLATDYGRWIAMSYELLRHLPLDRRDQVMSGTATRVYRLNQQQ